MPISDYTKEFKYNTKLAAPVILGMLGHQVVALVDEQGAEVARGLTNYNRAEVDALRGQSSEKIEELLGYCGDAEVIHRDNLLLAH